MVPELCPNWFQGFNLAFQIMFLAITLSISWTAYQVYKFFEKEEQKFLSLGWAVIALSYIAAIVSGATHLMGGERIVAIVTLYASTYLFLAGILVLLFAYLRIYQPAVRALLLIFAFAFMALISTPSIAMQDSAFHLIIAVLMFFIVGQMMLNYRVNCHRSALLVTTGFTLLTTAQLIMVFATYNELFFVVASILTFIGFVAIASRRLTVR